MELRELRGGKVLGVAPVPDESAMLVFIAKDDMLYVVTVRDVTISVESSMMKIERIMATRVVGGTVLEIKRHEFKVQNGAWIYTINFSNSGIKVRDLGNAHERLFDVGVYVGYLDAVYSKGKHEYPMPSMWVEGYKKGYRFVEELVGVIKKGPVRLSTIEEVRE